MGVCKCFWIFSLVVALLSVLAGYFYFKWLHDDFLKEVAFNLGEEGVQIFKAFDRNDDNYLSAEEFEPLYHSLIKRNEENGKSGLAELVYDVPVEPDDEVVTVVTTFQPLLLSSMSRSKDEGLGIADRVDSTPDSLRGLKNWRTANKEWHNFGVQHFKTFFPPEDVMVGRVYHIVEETQGFLSSLPIMSADLSSNRYFPPFVKEEHKIVYRLLHMFHPRPFIFNRFKPRGSVALVRAKSDEFIEIVFRIHAEFQLNELPSYPFWFTPGQFTGRLVVTSDFKGILHFNMYVPADKKLNVDMEWLEGSGMVVDIGYMPEMALHITSPSVPASQVNPEEKLSSGQFDISTIEWSDEILLPSALRMLEQQMYKFTTVPYFNFTESLTRAKEEDKLVHHLLLWGALDDQSC